MHLLVGGRIPKSDPAEPLKLLRAGRERPKRLGYYLLYLLFHIFHPFVRVTDLLRCRGGPNGLVRLCVDEVKDHMTINGIPNVLRDSVDRSLWFVQARSGSRMKALDVCCRVRGARFV